MNRIKHSLLVASSFSFLFWLAAGPLAAQTAPSAADSSSSLGDYARKLHKDPAAKATPKVFDNDNLPKEDRLSIVGQPEEPAPAADKAGDGSGAKPAASGDAKNPGAGKPGDGKDSAKLTPAEEEAKKQAEWKSWQEKISSQKNAIELASRELDVLQKEYQLRAAEMYADAGNRLRNSGDWDKQDADYKQKIADKQKAVNDSKQSLDDMQEAARKAGVPAAMLD